MSICVFVIWFAWNLPTHIKILGVNWESWFCRIASTMPYIFLNGSKTRAKFIEQKKGKNKNENKSEHAKKQTFRVDNVKQMQLFNHFLLNIYRICIGTTEENFISFRVRSLTRPFGRRSFFFFCSECFVLSFVSVCLCLALDSQKSYGLTYEFLEYAFQKRPRHLQSFFRFGRRRRRSFGVVSFTFHVDEICVQYATK